MEKKITNLNDTGKKKRKIICSTVNYAECIKLIAKSIKIELPHGGLHKLFIWKSDKKWGIIYRIYANSSKETVAETLKGLILQIKWTESKNILVPQKGYEDIARLIDIAETIKLKEYISLLK